MPSEKTAERLQAVTDNPAIDPDVKYVLGVLVNGEPEPDDADDGDDQGEPDVYDASTAEELREECRRRGLVSSGTKAELIARLRADDAQEGDTA